jgi:hypothetical protein
MVFFMLVCFSWLQLVAAGDTVDELCGGQAMDGTILFCQAKSLITVPTQIHVTTTRIKLGHNAITSLEETDLQFLVDLALLELESNSITEIAPGTFAKNTKLQGINLASNNLGMIPAGLWGVHTSLDFLYLHKNLKL